MRKFLRNLLLALIPVAVINALCWGTLVFLAWQDDLTYVNYAFALDKEKRLEEYRRKCKDEAIDMLKQYFYDLWD